MINVVEGGEQMVREGTRSGTQIRFKRLRRALKMGLKGKIARQRNEYMQHTGREQHDVWATGPAT